MTVSNHYPKPGYSLWYSLFAAPAAWLLQLLVSWLRLDHACTRDKVAASLRWQQIGISGVALLFALAALVIGFQLYRYHTRNGQDRLQGLSRPAFLALASIFVSATFLLGIVWAAWPGFTLPLCEAMR
ncbi:MAG: hypothetical protein R3F41_06735 [Gammaproteobacteria bacterium]|nr:hypothetical protein [Pseudomonadales bacterium]MCP5348611.1 hypothetical protein [Pseudomonadales bacterium]